MMHITSHRNFFERGVVRDDAPPEFRSVSGSVSIFVKLEVTVGIGSVDVGVCDAMDLNTRSGFFALRNVCLVGFCAIFSCCDKEC